MSQKEEVVLLRVQLDEGKTTDRIKELTLDLEKNSEAQKKLKADRKEGAIAEGEYVAQLVKLQQQQRAQRQEQTALTKNLDLYTKAVQGVGGSYAQSQAQLSLAQKQYQQLAGSAENSTEETQALAKVIDELRGTLKTTDAGMGLFVRNVGNYSGAIEPLIAEMKRLEAQQAKLEPDSPAFQKASGAIVGFQQRINQAGAEAGLTYEQTQAKLKGYGDSIAPVVEQLVRLEEEQGRVVEGSEQYNKIGFQIQKLKKDITEVPPENKKLTDSLEEVDNATGVFGGHVGGLKQAWYQGGLRCHWHRALHHCPGPAL
jgi:chromosome segregation ATPase